MALAAVVAVLHDCHEDSSPALLPGAFATEAVDFAVFIDLGTKHKSGLVNMVQSILLVTYSNILEQNTLDRRAHCNSVIRHFLRSTVLLIHTT